MKERNLLLEADFVKSMAAAASIMASEPSEFGRWCQAVWSTCNVLLEMTGHRTEMPNLADFPLLALHVAEMEKAFQRRLAVEEAIRAGQMDVDEIQKMAKMLMEMRPVAAAAKNLIEQCVDLICKAAQKPEEQKPNVGVHEHFWMKSADDKWKCVHCGAEREEKVS